MIDSHHLTSRFHLRSEGNILALVTQEGKDRFLYRKMFWDDLFGEAKLAQGFSRHHFGRQFRERNADGLAYERHGARGSWVDFEHVNVLALNRELHIHQSADVQLPRHRLSGG